MSPLPIDTRPALIDFGQQVRRVRMAAKISQRELGRRAHIGYRFISELELGRENPSLETIVLLSYGLGCELADLFPLNRDGR
jgi:transcriptional regulator with XRE-family HTH domain